MATIIKSYKVVGQLQHDESNDFTANYWGSESKEKMFPLPFWKARQMLALGDSNQIALRVKDIEYSDYVSAKWMILNESLVDALQDPVERGIYYFVIDDTIFNGPIISETGVRPGMIDAADFPHKSIIWGRIGKTTNDGGDDSYFAYLLVAECTILEPGAGGSSPACGAKIPPGGDE